jgi:hypothetical protein
VRLCLAPEPCSALNTEAILQGAILLPILDGRPDEERADDRSRQNDQEDDKCSDDDTHLRTLPGKDQPHAIPWAISGRAFVGWMLVAWAIQPGRGHQQP